MDLTTFGVDFTYETECPNCFEVQSIELEPTKELLTLPVGFRLKFTTIY